MDDDVILTPLRASDGSVRAWAVVSREDADLAELRWQIATDGYAQRNLPRRPKLPRVHERLHRVILSRIINRAIGPDEQCDHVNGNRLDNRRYNLRVATHGQNMANRKAWGLSRYLGVSAHKGKWQALIRQPAPGTEGRKIYLGLFADEAEAARAYDRAARECHGEYARLNFPDGDA